MKSNFVGFVGIVFCFLFVPQLTAQTLDLGFYPLVSQGGGVVNTSVIQSDGKILIAGAFPSVNGTGQRSVARLLLDGESDTSFLPISVSGTVNDLKLQADNKILLAGSFSSINTTSMQSIARLNADGSFDTSFVPRGLGIGANVKAIAVQPDGRIIAAGGFFQQGHLIRLNTNGTIDGTFQNSQDGSRILAAV